MTTPSNIRPSTRKSVGPLVPLAVLIATTSLAYEPLPWDSGADPTPSVSVTPTRDRRSSSRIAGVHMFGSFGMSYDWMARVGGDVDGVADGMGYSISIPATLPAWILYGLLADPLALFAPASSETWSSGFRGSGLRTAPVIDEVAFEFIYSFSSHADEQMDSDLSLARYALGIRTTGPGPSDRRLRGALSLGWCWHDLSYGDRDDVQASGPYAILGAEYRFDGQGRGQTIGVKFDARWDWAQGTDGAGGLFSNDMFTASTGVQLLW